LYESGLDVALAKISTEANRAIDVFYVAVAAGRKVVDVGACETIRQALLDALR
jgi:UTP:GlnB (protein PII) uridylyltransferase